MSAATMSRRGDESEEGVEDQPKRLCTPVYPGDPVKGSALRGARPKTIYDCFLGLLQDRAYHSVAELETVLPMGAWTVGMEEAILRGFAFERGWYKDEVFFRLRVREEKERRQVISDLLVGVKLPCPEPLTAPEEVEADLPVEFDLDSDLEVDQKDEVTEQGLVLSDPPEDLVLPPQVTFTMTAAILAQKGSGKTYLATVLVEEILSSPITAPVVIVDPLGQWWGLLAMANNTPSPFKLLVLGGKFGDFPISGKDGAKVAHLVKRGLPNSFLIDLSRMPVADQHEFMASFISTFYEIAESSPIHFVVDEADEYAPQQLQGSVHQKNSLYAMDRLVRRGRAKAIGITMITQRTAVISKNLLTQVDAVFLLNMGTPTDIKAVDAWLKIRVSNEHREECIREVPKLLPGNAYFLRGGKQPMFRRFVVRSKRTFDSSKTPTTGSSIVPARSQLDLNLLAVAKEVLGDKS